MTAPLTTEAVSRMAPVIKVMLQLGGIGGLIAIYLVWALATGVNVNTAATNQMMLAERQETQDAAKELTAIKNLLLQSCVNDAGIDLAKRNACFDSQFFAPRR